MNGKKAKKLRAMATDILINRMVSYLSDEDVKKFHSLPKEEQISLASSGNNNSRNIYKQLKKGIKLWEGLGMMST